MDIMKLLDNNGIKLKKVSFRELAGPCPFCGGRDRLRVWPDERGGAFWCRVCGKGGDMAKYHMLTTGKRYFDACYDLGVEPRFKPRRKWSATFESCPLPPIAWRAQAAKVLEQYHNALLSKKGAPARSWLAGRGILERTIKRTQLGLNNSEAFFERTSWGLSEEISEKTGKPKRIWIPAGLVIPCVVAGEPIRIRVRRDKAEDGNRYVTVPGGSKQPMRLGRLSRVTVVESDLDAMLISQEAGDLVSVVSLGSASLRPDAETHSYLQTAEKILLALDYDAAGSAQAAWWQRHYGPKIQRWPVPKGKDPGEAFQQGVDIRIWIKAGI
jgi:hypothetical protein